MPTVIRFLLPVLLLLGLTAEAEAQFSFTALEGIPASRTMATDSLGAGAELVMIGTLGEVDLQGFNLSFDLETGEAMAWIYVWRGAGSGRLLSIAVIRIFVYQAFTAGELPLPGPGLVRKVGTTGAYADSDAMIDKLGKNDTFAQYRLDYPGNLPTFLTLGQLLPESVPLPEWFPLAQAIWTVSFSGDGDSAMTCFVGADGGESFCLQRPEFLSVEDDRAGQGGRLTLRGSHPVDRGEGVRIGIDGRGLHTPPRLLLLNSLGEEVANLDRHAAEAVRPGSEISFDLPMEGRPAGIYHLLLQTPTGTERLSLVVR